MSKVRSLAKPGAADNGPRVALVTGASKGLGAAIARRLAADGFDIWLNYRGDELGAQAVAEDVRALGRDCVLLKADVADKSAVEAVLTPVLDKTAPYAVINNAGFAKDSLLIWMDEDSWKSVLDVTLDGFYHVTRAALPSMLRRRAGRIVNISSTSGQSGLPGQVNYSAAKAGLIGATKALAAEIGKRGITVNAVAPGYIDTEMLDRLPAPLSKDQIASRVPLGRLGRPEEIAAAVSFLCSPDAAYVTGQVLAVNGGIYL
jgi:3-oxoacyl-[acyl-carrier protein] reductase